MSDEDDDRTVHLLSATVWEPNEDHDPSDPEEPEPEYIMHGASICGVDDWREDAYSSLRSKVTCGKCLELMVAAEGE